MPRQARGIVRIVPIVLEGIGGAPPARQPTALRTDPQVAGRILGQHRDPVVGQGGGIGRIVPVDLEAVPVVAVEAALSTEPHETRSVLNEAVDEALRQPLRDRQSLEAHRAMPDFHDAGTVDLGRDRQHVLVEVPLGRRHRAAGITRAIPPDTFLGIARAGCVIVERWSVVRVGGDD